MLQKSPYTGYPVHSSYRYNKNAVLNCPTRTNPYICATNQQISSLMKKAVAFSLFLIAFCCSIAAQSIDVLHLQNGSIIRGSIVEFEPQGNVKIQTADGSLFVYPSSEVVKIEKDQAVSTQTYQSAQSLTIPTSQVKRDGRKIRFKDNNQILSDNDVLNLMGADYYDTYKSARRQITSSYIFAGAEFASLIGVFVFSDRATSAPVQEERDENILYMNLCNVYTNAFCCLAIVYYYIGKGRMDWVVNSYNQGKPFTASLNLTPSLMTTPQNNYGLGASVRLTF